MYSFITTTIVLLAFAANSILCRLALAEDAIDPLSFSIVRLISGALLLSILVVPKKAEIQLFKSSLFSAAGLSLYAFAFSYAYVRLDAGMGALILFATIQLAMNGLAFKDGSHFSKMTLAGIGIAFIGLVLLLLPGQSSPDLMSAAIMMLSAIGWTAFVYAGRNNASPLQDVALAFRWSLLWCIPLAFFADWQSVSDQGVVLAVISGAITSGLGYALWYRILPSLGMQKAAQVQLAVPALAILLGVLLLGELLTVMMLIATTLILIGIFVSIRGKSPQ